MSIRTVTSLFLGPALLLWVGWGASRTAASPVRPEREKALAKSVEIPGASSVGSETCTGCHDDTGKSFQHAYHK